MNRPDSGPRQSKKLLPDEEIPFPITMSITDELVLEVWAVTDRPSPDVVGRICVDAIQTYAKQNYGMEFARSSCEVNWVPELCAYKYPGSEEPKPTIRPTLQLLFSGYAAHQLRTILENEDCQTNTASWLRERVAEKVNAETMSHFGPTLG